MTRRAAVLILCAASAHADAAPDAWGAITTAASSLAQSNSSAFLACFDKEMQGYETLRANIGALLMQAEVISSVDQLENRGDDQTRTLELDWLMRMRPRSGVAPTIQREERVKCVVTKRGQKWRITKFEPLSLFAPI
jgi:hypothetical protein